MLLRRSQPTIRKLSDPTRPALSGPVSLLERNPQSPKGWKNRESDGIGLGIVAALGRSDSRKISEKIKYVSAPISIGGYSSRGAELGCNWRTCCDGRKTEKDVRGLFCVSPLRVTDDLSRFRMADFLNYCYLCRKRLHGKDIYMYRGEKAFCSMECRYQQIVGDECHEKCGSEALRSSDASRSSYTDDRLFFTGIAAA